LPETPGGQPAVVWRRHESGAPIRVSLRFRDDAVVELIR
jgi:hypothetical protein